MLTNIYEINGAAMVAPDEDVVIRYENAGEQSLMDEGGFLHKKALRRGITTWQFTYACLSRQQRDQLMGLFGADTFWFTHPDRLDPQKSDRSLCYLESCSECLQSVAEETYRNVKLTIRQC